MKRCLRFLSVISFASILLLIANTNCPATIVKETEKTIQVESRIIKFNEESIKGKTFYELYLGNGMVATIASENSQLGETLHFANIAKNLISEKKIGAFLLRERDFRVLAIHESKSKGESNQEELSVSPFPILKERNPLYNLLTVRGAFSVFQRMHQNFRGDRRVFSRNPSECYRRAEVWSYELEAKEQIESRKFFLMFMGKYRQGNCRYKWWFHVTPYVWVEGDDRRVFPMTMDRMYSDGPQLKENWYRMFVNSEKGGCEVPSNVICPVISRFDYGLYQKEFLNYYCVLIDTPRFYYYPTDIEQASSRGLDKVMWDQANLNDAYREKI